MGTGQHSKGQQHPHRQRKKAHGGRTSALWSLLTIGCVSEPSGSDEYTLKSQWLDEYQQEAPKDKSSFAYYPATGLDVHLKSAFKDFLEEYPAYKLTGALDTLRRSNFARLDKSKETYVDYMGGSLYPEILVRTHMEFLQSNVMGNTHSVNNSSYLSAKHANDARQTVLSFFEAPPDYTVVFTSNASGALKLVGEAFPFTEESSFVLGEDSHNSVHGIRRYASGRGARVSYIKAMPQGGVDEQEAMSILQEHSTSDPNALSLFALTGQSNISNSKMPLSLIQYAASCGYCTLLDAAALAPTSVISLSNTPVDAMAISFYKMFGFPTGVGALIAKKSFLARLERPWFAGGTVNVVQTPGTAVTMAEALHEQFEDGTINYLSLPAITEGLQLLSVYLPVLPLRLSILTQYLIKSLLRIQHETTGTPVTRILSRLPIQKLQSLGDQADAGFIVSLLFVDPTGEIMPLSLIEHAAAAKRISLRVGCMCNPGGAVALMGVSDMMASFIPGTKLRDIEAQFGREFGVVRISLGLASNFDDVWKVLEFARALSKQQTREAMESAWLASRSI